VLALAARQMIVIQAQAWARHALAIEDELPAARQHTL
jgi:hypothetical protein